MLGQGSFKKLRNIFDTVNYFLLINYSSTKLRHVRILWIPMLMHRHFGSVYVTYGENKIGVSFQINRSDSFLLSIDQS